MPDSLPLIAVHHVARTTSHVEQSRAFYRDVMGFREIERPNFAFGGAWLYNCGVQMHLIERGAAAAQQQEEEIQTRDDHLAFHTDNTERIEVLLREHGVAYRVNVQAGTGLKQLFFRDPDGHHIEVGCYPPTPAYLA